MELLRKKVPVNHNLFLIGDDHEGTILRHHDGWAQFVDHACSSIDGLPEKANFIVDHGDIIDAIDPMDPRYDGLTEDGLILQQIERAIKNRTAIRDKIVCILDGNHPLKKWRFGRITPHICEKLNVPYGGWSAKITYSNTRNEILYKHFCIHGKRSINSAADDPKRRRTNKLLTLKRLLKFKAGDCVLMSRGHTHWLDRLTPEHDMYLIDDTQKVHQAWTKADQTAEYIHPDLRWYVSTGSFVKTVLANKGISGYAEIAEYDPQLMGYMICKVRGGVITEIESIPVD